MAPMYFIGLLKSKVQLFSYYDHVKILVLKFYLVNLNYLKVIN